MWEKTIEKCNEDKYNQQRAKRQLWDDEGDTE